MADLALHDKSKSELIEHIERGQKRSRAKALLAKAQKLPKLAFGSVASAAGGALAGILVSKYPRVGDTPVTGADIAAVAAIVGGAMADGDIADLTVDAGKGLLAGDAAIRSYQYWEKK